MTHCAHFVTNTLRAWHICWMHECREFHNCYNRRHNRIADKIADEIKQSCPRSRVYSNKMLETVFPEFHDQLVLFPHRKPDILVIDPVLKSCIVVEVTVCFDLYFGYAFDGKCERYEPLCNFLRERNWNIKMVVLCFGSLGCIKKDVWRGMRALSIGKVTAKRLLGWCSLSNIIMANYIWRHRVKKLFSTF